MTKELSDQYDSADAWHNLLHDLAAEISDCPDQAERPLTGIEQKVFDELDALLISDEPAEPSPVDNALAVKVFKFSENLLTRLRDAASKHPEVIRLTRAGTLEAPKTSVKNSAKRKRKSRARDARNIRKCEALLKGQPVPAKPSLVHNTTHNLSTSPYRRTGEARPYSSAYIKHLQADRNDNRKMAAWEFLEELGKMYAASAAMSEQGALAFTLNLGGRVRAYVEANPAKARTYLADRLYKALKAAFGYEAPYCFVLEVSPSGRLHVHGMLMVDPAAKKQTITALQKAGGMWEGKGATYQADARRMFNARGWASYCAKTLARTKKFLGVKNVLSMSHSVSRLAQDFWNRMRSSEKLLVA